MFTDFGLIVLAAILTAWEKDPVSTVLGALMLFIFMMLMFTLSAAQENRTESAGKETL